MNRITRYFKRDVRMNKEEMICKNCKYHYIEKISFDYPQSCCSKRKAIIEEWFNYNDFEYNDKYIEQLQQENKQLKDNWNKLKDFIVREYYMYLPLKASVRSITILIDKMQELERNDSKW